MTPSATAALDPPRASARAADPPARHAHAVLFAATCVIAGVLWDISWHESIGRDTFWSPPHMAIYLGGLVAGLSGAWLVFRTTIAARRASAAGGREARPQPGTGDPHPAGGAPQADQDPSPGVRAAAAPAAAGVRVFGLRAPLGAWVALWGAGAMLTSAPFDDWWHNAYGLDVEILSPPHVVLALGIGAIVLGALLAALALQNAPGRYAARRLAPLTAYAFGLLVTLAAILATEHTFRIYMHNAHFYKVTAAAFPFLLVAAGRAVRLRWPATTAALVYMGILLAFILVLPRFPAEPRLAPVLRPIDRMVAPHFPLLLVAPAVVLDLILRRFGPGRRDWLLAAALGAAFFAVYAPAQWFFAELLMTPAYRASFLAYDMPYWIPPGAYADRGAFLLLDAGPGDTARGLLVALGFAMASARLGLWFGNGLARIRR